MEKRSMLVIICGKGKMAAEIIRVADLDDSFEYSSFDKYGNQILRNNTLKALIQNGRAVAIHFGSGVHLIDLLAFCSKYKVPLLQCSTLGPKMPELPPDPDFLLVKAPNTALPIVELFAALPALAKVFEGMKVEITHSHQKEKTTMPGTAKRFAETFGVPVAEIKTPKDDDERERLGVPQKHLSWHGHHFITADAPGISINLSTHINGGEIYARGALQIAREIVDSGLELTGVYDVEVVRALIKNKWQPMLGQNTDVYDR